MNRNDNGRGKVVYELIDEDLERLKTILDELRVIFDAESVALLQPEYSMYRKTDLEIKIYGSTLGMEELEDIKHRI